MRAVTAPRPAHPGDRYDLVMITCGRTIRDRSLHRAMRSTVPVCASLVPVVVV